jgi:hypothetical protein
MMLNGNVVPAMSRGFEESDLKILKISESHKLVKPPWKIYVNE